MTNDTMPQAHMAAMTRAIERREEEAEELKALIASVAEQRAKGRRAGGDDDALSEFSNEMAGKSPQPRGTQAAGIAPAPADVPPGLTEEQVGRVSFISANCFGHLGELFCEPRRIDLFISANFSVHLGEL